MKKNELTDKNYAKGSKGFYAALGISAVMIGAACLFAHDQGDRIAEKAPKSDKSPVIVHEAPAAKNVTDVPKAAASPAVTTAVTAAPVTVDVPQLTIPAAKITADAPFEADSSFTDPASPAAAEAGMKDAVPPLKDMSSILGSFSGGELVRNETTGTWQGALYIGRAADCAYNAAPLRPVALLYRKVGAEAAVFSDNFRGWAPGFHR